VDLLVIFIQAQSQIHIQQVRYHTQVIQIRQTKVLQAKLVQELYQTVSGIHKHQCNPQQRELPPAKLQPK